MKPFGVATLSKRCSRCNKKTKTCPVPWIALTADVDPVYPFRAYLCDPCVAEFISELDCRYQRREVPMEPINLSISVFVQGMCAGASVLAAALLILAGLLKAKEKRGP